MATFPPDEQGPAMLAPQTQRGITPGAQACGIYAGTRDISEHLLQGLVEQGDGSIVGALAKAGIDAGRDLSAHRAIVWRVQRQQPARRRVTSVAGGGRMPGMGAFIFLVRGRRRAPCCTSTTCALNARSSAYKAGANISSADLARLENNMRVVTA